MSNDIVRASEITFNEGLLRLAAIHDKRVRFVYARDPNKPIETRYLEPSDVTIVNAGRFGEHVTVSGFDPIRQEPRNYRLDRIALDAEIV